MYMRRARVQKVPLLDLMLAVGAEGNIRSRCRIGDRFCGRREAAVGAIKAAVAEDGSWVKL